MTRIPHSATEHLRRMAPAGDHPDANLLSAFAEGALAQAERGSVMQHLAACADCREALVLAQPEQAEVLPAGREIGSWWLRSPFLRWAGLAASMAVVAGVLMLQLARQQDVRLAEAIPEPPPAQAPALQAETAKTVEAGAAADKTDSQPAVQTGRQQAGRELRTAGGSVSIAAPRERASTPAPLTTVSSAESSAQAAPKPARTDAPVQLADAGAQKKSEEAFVRAQIVPPAPPPPPAPVERDDIRPATTGWYAAKSKTSEGGFFISESNLNSVDATKETKTDALAANTRSGAVASASGAAAAQPGVVGELARTNEDQKVGFAQSRAPSSAGNPPVALRAMATIEARWRLVNGELQRSFDDGRNWEDVPIAAEVSPRAVDARAPVVWVAGDQRDLYQSSDNGLRWQRVQLPDTLTGDVRELKARDRLRVDLTTSTGERWTTEDGGRTWQRK